MELFGYQPRSDASGPHVSSTFTFQRHSQTDSCKGCVHCTPTNSKSGFFFPYILASIFCQSSLRIFLGIKSWFCDSGHFCSNRGVGFQSQHPYDDSQVFVTPVPRELPPSSGLLQHLACTGTQTNLSAKHSNHISKTMKYK